MMEEDSFSLRSLTAEFRPGRTNDEVHSSIRLCALSKAFIDTPPMQRLRGLKQLGCCEMAYVTTTHCRFEHSLGVMHLAESLAREIKRRQRQLQTTEKDIVCVKLAGLCHDLGHGPFSHVFESMFLPIVKKAQKDGQWLGHKFDSSCYEGIPELPEHWEHEHGSCMMLDALLAFHGLAVDEDRLDDPLKQIGPGIKADCFGIVDQIDEDDLLIESGMEPLPSNRVLTSRDIIFIKECIVGGPLLYPLTNLQRDGDANVKFIGRSDAHKEWLYDIVSNRHSGLDVDKIDYFARDGRRALGKAGKVDPIFIEEAFVCWGDCPRPEKCFRCHRTNSSDLDRKMSPQIDGGADCSDDHSGMHLMICYPAKMIGPVMNFFQERFQNHQKIYTHQKVVASEFLLCDALVLAEPYLRISTLDEGDGTGQHSESNRSIPPAVPISRAVLYPSSYLRLTDGVLNLIGNSVCDKLRPARQLLARYKARNKMYKRVGQLEISLDGEDADSAWHAYIWSMDEDKIAEDIAKIHLLLRSDGGVDIKPHDIAVEKRVIHHGKKAENPVNSVLFLKKNQVSQLRKPLNELPVAQKMREKTYETDKPVRFLKRTLRVYCRSYGEEVTVQNRFLNWLEYSKKKAFQSWQAHMPLGVAAVKVPGACPPNMLTQESEVDITPLRDNGRENMPYFAAASLDPQNDNDASKPHGGSKRRRLINSFLEDDSPAEKSD